MELTHTRRLFLIAAGFVLGACVHTPAGTSVEYALAKKAELVRMPEPPPSPVVQNRPVEPELPSTNVPATKKDKEKDKAELVADAFTRGQFSMKAGKDEEAIAAFEETVKLDPNFTDAWQNLAILYEKKGETQKAIDAFKRSKKVARG